MYYIFDVPFATSLCKPLANIVFGSANCKIEAKPHKQNIIVYRNMYIMDNNVRFKPPYCQRKFAWETRKLGVLAPPHLTTSLTSHITRHAHHSHRSRHTSHITPHHSHLTSHHITHISHHTALTSLTSRITSHHIAHISHPHLSSHSTHILHIPHPHPTTSITSHIHISHHISPHSSIIHITFHHITHIIRIIHHTSPITSHHITPYLTSHFTTSLTSRTTTSPTSHITSHHITHISLFVATRNISWCWRVTFRSKRNMWRCSTENGTFFCRGKRNNISSSFVAGTACAKFG